MNSSGLFLLVSQGAYPAFFSYQLFGNIYRSCILAKSFSVLYNLESLERTPFPAIAPFITLLPANIPHTKNSSASFHLRHTYLSNTSLELVTAFMHACMHADTIIKMRRSLCFDYYNIFHNSSRLINISVYIFKTTIIFWNIEKSTYPIYFSPSRHESKHTHSHSKT